MRAVALLSAVVTGGNRPEPFFRRISGYRAGTLWLQWETVLSYTITCQNFGEFGSLLQTESTGFDSWLSIGLIPPR